MGSGLPVGWADFDAVGPSSAVRPFIGLTLSGWAASQALKVQQSGETQDVQFALLNEFGVQSAAYGQAAIQ